jgi:hypothetical protein
VSADDRQAALAHEVDHDGHVRRERAVEGGEAQRHALDALLVARGADLGLGRRDRVDDRLDAWVALVADRVVLGARALMGAEAVDAEERLAHEAPRAGRHGGVEEVAHAALAQLVGRAHGRRPGGLGRDAGQHVDHGVWACGANGARQPSGSMASATTGSAPSSASIGAFAALEVMATTSWPRSSSSRTGRRADGPARSGEEDSHRVHALYDEMARRAVTTRVSQ